MFSRNPSSIPGAHNLRLYLSSAVLPKLIPGATAPPMFPDGHKSHLNHLRIQPEPYRTRFAKIIAEKDIEVFDDAVLEFCGKLPNEKIDLPNQDETTGFAFTIPAPGFNVQCPPFPRPTTIHELSPITLALPLQTLTRAMHVAFPDASQQWDITYVGNEADPTLWQTLVWRKAPPPSHLETFWVDNVNQLEKCSVVFVVQPPWVLTAQDMKSFVKCSNMTMFNAWDPSESQPYKAAERIWAKLWDECVRRSCHHWVLTTYWGWIFGAFSAGFTGGQVFASKTYDCQEPTIMQCLVHHVASSMGLATGLQLPQYLERHDQMAWNSDIPEPAANLYVEFPDSGSEWDGMDDELEISAGLSQDGYPILSAHGSEQDFPRQTFSLVARNDGRAGYRRVPLSREKASEVVRWQVTSSDLPPPYSPERSPSVAPSEAGSAISTFAEYFQQGSRESSLEPDVKVVRHNGAIGFGGLLTTVPEQEAT